MALYRVGIQYSVYGYIDVEAESEEEAFDIANREDNGYCCEDLKDDDYLQGSWMADRESIDLLTAKRWNDWEE